MDVRCFLLLAMSTTIPLCCAEIGKMNLEPVPGALSDSCTHGKSKPVGKHGVVRDAGNRIYVHQNASFQLACNGSVSNTSDTMAPSVGHGCKWADSEYKPLHKPDDHPDGSRCSVVITRALFERDLQVQDTQMTVRCTDHVLQHEEKSYLLILAQSLRWSAVDPPLIVRPDHVVFMCSVFSRPHACVTWFFNNRHPSANAELRECSVSGSRLSCPIANISRILPIICVATTEWGESLSRIYSDLPDNLTATSDCNTSMDSSGSNVTAVNTAGEEIRANSNNCTCANISFVAPESGNKLMPNSSSQVAALNMYQPLDDDNTGGLLDLTPAPVIDAADKTQPTDIGNG
ncbi:uncharacterized protein LOC129601086 isoform X2 [Paramacrobiotus metropolitanus]|uniref:uncharacterized protein LOC129601086 isoform X2 n=1 Tax=Paramacrobiotus metropolitanus TaxID=2943436 RepID=UPI002445C1AE|nr:uncharacterized protein LOC129601086 isoform X2 [Paramacrobiotus metropolitanus]